MISEAELRRWAGAWSADPMVVDLDVLSANPNGVGGSSSFPYALNQRHRRLDVKCPPPPASRGTKEAQLNLS